MRFAPEPEFRGSDQSSVTQFVELLGGRISNSQYRSQRRLEVDGNCPSVLYRRKLLITKRHKGEGSALVLIGKDTYWF